jgi:hypothetical protein
MNPPAWFSKTRSGSTRAKEIPMRRFLNNLFRDFRSTSTARGSRRAPRGATLQVEGLEDRMVLSTANPLGSTALLNHTSAGPSVVLTQPIVKLSTIKASTTNQAITGVSFYIGQPALITISTDGAGHIDVVGPYIGLNDQFPIATVRSFSIVVQSGSNVQIDDSKGMPFAPGTTVDLSGPSPESIGLTLFGTRTLSGNETFVAGTASTPGSISLAGVTFTLHSAIGPVYDSIPITGNFDVQTSGTQVQPYGYRGYQYLSGLGNGGGDFLTYSTKPSVTLDTLAPNASIFLGDGAVGASSYTVNMHGAGETIFLDAPDPAAGYSYLTVNMQGAGETTTLDQTPKNVTTVVNVDPPATNAIVNLWGNFGPVTIDGDSTTGVSVGYPLASTGTITSGIEAPVTVEGASYLQVNNSGNVTTKENVTVTDRTISGSGLFGNNGSLTYGGVQQIDMLTGQLLDVYTVTPSSPNARFTSAIDIFSNSSVGFHVTVDLNAPSDLNLTLYNQRPQLGVLVVNTNGFVDPSHTIPNGIIDVLLAGQPTSVISYNGFDYVPGG